jgi:hypothetical protein
VYVRDDDVWSIRGRYNDALEDDEGVVWQFQDGEMILPLLIVSDIHAEFSVY